MDKQTLIYLFFLGIYFISWVLKRSRKSKTGGNVTSKKKTPRNTGKSLEEMLREFTQELAPEDEVYTESTRAPYAERRTAVESLPREKKVEWKEIPAERNKYQVALDEGLEVKPLAATQINPLEKNEHFKSFALRKKENRLIKGIRKQLTSQQGAKKAIVLAEVLKQKF